MVSQNSPPNTSSSMLRQFIISDSISSQTRLESQHFDAYCSVLRRNINTTFSQSSSSSLGLLPAIHAPGETMSRSKDLLPVSAVAEEQLMMDLPEAANESGDHHTQRLSLALGSRNLVPPASFMQGSLNSNVSSPTYLITGEDREVCNPVLRHIPDYYSLAASTNQPFATAIVSSRYLKASQSLLEEIVSVDSRDVEENFPEVLFLGGKRGFRFSSEFKAEFCSNEMLLPEKQELHIKMAKLISLLEEVEERYERYRHQMEEVVSSFEAMAGVGAAKFYTALTLQAMSGHFWSLRDAIVAQLNVTRRKFMHDLPKISTGMSQLSLFNRESRSNRLSLEQLGLMQQQTQARRPIRGLPDTSVAILRSWLFEHFLHPYPRDSEKLMLASQTGLSKNQVSNWFINARVRLWKPMIEEMYREEFRELS
ncbi:hypothetical protein SLE2022_099220 [Rubroshorea leprosula]